MPPPIRILLWTLAVAALTLAARSQDNGSDAAALATRYADAVEEARARDDLDTVRGLLGAAVEELGQLDALREASSGELDFALVRLVNQARAVGEVLPELTLTRWVVAGRETLLPADHPTLLDGYEMLGIVLRESGDPRAAREVEFELVAARERTLDAADPALERARSNLALTYAALGELREAFEMMEEVVASREERLPAGARDLFAARLNAAEILSRMGDLERALLLQERVVSDMRELRPDDADFLATAVMNLGVVRAGLRDFEGARTAFEEALVIRREFLPPTHPDLIQAERNLASVYGSLGEFEASIEGLERIIDALASRYPSSHPQVVGARFNLAIATMRAGEVSAARELFREVADHRNEILPPSHIERLRALMGVAVTCARLGDSAEVEEVLGDVIEGLLARYIESLSVSPREARAALRGDTSHFSCAVFLAEYTSREANLFDLIETRRHVATAPLRVPDGGGELGDLQADLARVRQELNDRVYAGPGPGESVDAWRDAIVRRSVVRDGLLAKLRGALREDGMFLERIEAGQLAQALPADSIAVGFLLRRHAERNPEERILEEREKRYVAIVLLPDGRVHSVPIGTQIEVEERVEAWRNAVLESPELERAAGNALRELIFDPLLSVGGMQDSPPREVFLAPDAALHLVPIDALPLAASPDRAGERVGDRYRIRTEISFARLLRTDGARAQADELGLVLLGDADFEAPLEPEATAVVALAQTSRDALLRSGPFRSWERLQGTVEEMAAIAATYTQVFGRAPVTLSGAGATKAQLYEHVRGKRYVHLATHGWFSPRAGVESPQGDDAFLAPVVRTLEGFVPMTLCGLCLAGANRGRDEVGRVPGLLTAEELASYDLASCELAVLSACETNVGLRPDGQGILSLQSALHAAGARAAVTSLWRVDDALTRELMDAFYENLWQRKMGKADALWAAKQAMRARRHPISAWAGWVLTGDPD